MVGQASASNLHSLERQADLLAVQHPAQSLLLSQTQMVGQPALVVLWAHLHDLLCQLGAIRLIGSLQQDDAQLLQEVGVGCQGTQSPPLLLLLCSVQQGGKDLQQNTTKWVRNNHMASPN